MKSFEEFVKNRTTRKFKKFMGWNLSLPKMRELLFKDDNGAEFRETTKRNYEVLLRLAK